MLGASRAGYPVRVMRLGSRWRQAFVCLPSHGCEEGGDYEGVCSDALRP